MGLKKSQQQLFTITLRYHNNMTRKVNVKASTREVAEQRALKRNPAALGVVTNA